MGLWFAQYESRAMANVKLVINDVVYPGKGLARMEDGCVVFVSGVLPGETVEVEITKQKKNFAEARLIEVIKPSQFRMPPKCKLADICPGCRYQHAEYGEELRLKQAQFINLLERQAKVDATGFCLPPIPSPVSLEYRNKIVLHAAVADDAGSLGYFGEDNDTVIDVASCPLAMRPLNDLLADLRARQDFMAALKPDMRVTLRYTKTDGAVHWCGKPKADDSWLRESTSIGSIKVPRGGFFQMNPAMADELVKHVLDLINTIKPERVIDLYCGVGVFAMAAGLAGIGKVFGIDSDKEAVLAAKSNAQDRGLEGVQFIAAAAEKGLKYMLGSGTPGKTTLIVDPPRMGLEKCVVELINSAKPSDVVYVSCAPDTLARDIALLKAGEYRVVSSLLLDMFPRTPYFESVTHLKSARNLTAG
jgi:23S rRNA (uracil1939-C5)-methyltransferase